MSKIASRYIAVSFLCNILFASANQRICAQSLLPESPISSSLSSSITGSTRSFPFALNPSQSRADSVGPIHAAIAFTPFAGGLKDARQSEAELTCFANAINSSLGLGITELSFSDLYTDISLEATYARSFVLSGMRMATAGIRFRYESISTTPLYPKLHFLLADLGLAFDLTPEFSIGATAINLLGARYQITDGEYESLQRRFLVGFAYHPIAVPITVLTSVAEASRSNAAIGFGLEYSMTSFIVLRLGTSTDTGNITTGIGIRYGTLAFDVGSRFDKALGSIFSFGATGVW